MAVEAGGVDIVVGLKSTTFTAGMREIKKGIADLDGQTKQFSSHTVSGMQAASASIRLLENPLGNNTRAIERLLSQSKLLSGAMQVAFPVVGMVAAGSILFKLGNDVAEFIKKTQQMPRNLELGFAAMNQSSQMADDALKVTNDRLDEQIAKLEHKPVNGMALALDEARVNADKLAESLARDSKAMSELMKENQTGILAQAFAGKDSTAGVSNSVNLYNRQMQSLGTQNSIALHDGDKGQSAALVKQMADLTDAERSRLKTEIAMRSGKVDYEDPETAKTTQLDYGQVHGDQTSNLNIERGALNQLTLRDEMATDQTSNVQKTGQVAGLESQKALNAQAAEARRKAAEEMRQSWEADASVFKAWQEYAKNIQSYSSEYVNAQFKSSGVSTDDSKSLGEQGNGATAYIQSLSQSIELRKQDSNAIAEASIQMALATGQITKLGAAQAVASMHTQDYTDAMQKLNAQRDYISSSSEYNGNPLARQAALQDNQNRTDSLTAGRVIQIAQDAQTTSPGSSSPFVGATDALNEFVIASRDAAKQISEFTTSTITGFNDVLLKVMTTRSTGHQNRIAFGDYGAGLFRSVANTGLQKAEGSALGAFGFGSSAKMGTQSNPMWTRSVDAIGGGVSSAVNSAGSFLSKMFGGGKGPGASGLAGAMDFSTGAAADDAAAGGISTIDSTLTDMIPFFADGSPGSMSGPAIIGERGPELFVPSGTGNVIPNHKMGNAQAGHTIMIDASGSTDPAQTRVQVMQGIAAAAPHIANGAISAQRDDKRRSPSSQR
jgi:hypothetical protein